MATTMFAVDCPANAWTEIVSGAAFASFGVQLELIYPVALAIGTAEPASNARGVVVLSGDGTRELALDLAANEKLYARPTVQASAVRGYKVAR